MLSSRDPEIARRVRDVIVVVVIVAFAVLPIPDDLYRARGLLVIPALLPAGVMLVRRKWPLLALAVSLLCALLIATAGTIAPSALVAAAVGAFAVVDQRGRLIGLIAVASAALVAYLSNGVALGGDLFDSTAFQFVVLILLGGALGDATRSRREVVSAITERAERAEQGRDEEARRRVAEERVRIARDLHDVVAHQISVISLNAGVASSALETRPERAREALTTIRSASRTVLTDIGGLMALLRADDADDAEDARSLRPQSGLAELDALIARFTAVGLHVEVDRERTAVALSPASDHVAYLALLEGLTNAHKHGADAAVFVSIGTDADALVLTLVNARREAPSDRAVSGHGLRGLRERVTAVRGQVSTDDAGGRFVLSVRIPTERSSR
ncbi:sensor histidine kinase [Microbacterium sp. SSW1-49]|uniref:histidine kinase n=1 Tax=Microbacterium croceum TaxID=2851645 RepID=A0ABT0FFL3_9MICO|nr:histidine kinase [Microbacterium croceum]MCK2036860.1 sensor histidine kinase [Microbacterium croceum]